MTSTQITVVAVSLIAGLIVCVILAIVALLVSLRMQERHRRLREWADSRTEASDRAAADALLDADLWRARAQRAEHRLNPTATDRGPRWTGQPDRPGRPGGGDATATMTGLVHGREAT